MLEPLIDWYERLSPDNLGEIDRYYLPDASFRDPFNDVSGLTAIEGIFRHMFDTTDNPRFRVTDQQSEGHVAWLRWTFECRLRGRFIHFEGASRLLFGEDGRVVDHHDFWDASDLFLQLPLLGTMVHFLKKRLSVFASYPGQERKSHER